MKFLVQLILFSQKESLFLIISVKLHDFGEEILSTTKDKASNWQHLLQV